MLLPSMTGKGFIVLTLTVILGCLWAIDITATESREVNSSDKVKANDKIIDPHFTGKDCDVCHDGVPVPGRKDFKLKFKNDIEMCNSCHQTEYVQGDLHDSDIVPPDNLSICIPEEMPLYDGKVTCRTCHDVFLQCKSDASEQLKNISFLRGPPFKKISDFCFRCHNSDYYVKINPHHQIDKKGEVLTDKCLYCHQTLPDPETALDIKDVNFKACNPAFCSVCHWEQLPLHPARANHMLEPSRKILTAIRKSEKKFDVILPLFNGEVFCGTCHNPHDKGVIIRGPAAKGSAEKLELRLDWSYDLCVACHAEKEDLSVREVSIDINNEDLLVSSSDEPLPSYHKSFLEKKCRACHSITRQSPERPPVIKMCFQADCHNTSIVKQEFKHRDAQKGYCLICHNAHGSQYGAHILNDQQRLCTACHPLLGKRDVGTEGKDSEDLHDYYLALMIKLVPDQKITCSYCHGEDHTEKINETGIVPCYECHNFIKKLIQGKANKPKDIHETFKIKRCVECHEPHSSPFPQLLKQEPESYLQPDS